MSISVVVPTYNEGARLAKTIEQLLLTNYQIIVVDDGSIDETAEIALQYPVHLLTHTINCGQGAALKTGTEYARQLGSKIIAHFDADGQHRVKDLKNLVEYLQNNELDIVLGSRFMNQETNFPLRKKIILNFAKVFSNKIIGLNFTDPQSGLRVFRSAILEQLDWQKKDFLHCTEILTLIMNHKLKYAELPVVVSYDSTSKKDEHPRISMGLKILLNKIIG